MATRRLETEELKLCPSCAARVLQCDNYCRGCGIRQRARAAVESVHWSESKTERVGCTNATGLTISSRLVEAITQSLAVRTKPLRWSPSGLLVITGLVLVPIWLLLVLLSPVEAYVAARSASCQMNCE